VVTTAKADLAAGTDLDGFGGYATYGQCENADVVRAGRILPMGVSPGCRLRRAARRDEVLRYDDVELPAERLVDRLRAEQDHLFADSVRTKEADPGEVRRNIARKRASAT